jgi:hypothetical protein
MEPYPEHCLICGREITTGIDAHIKRLHKMNYAEYRRWFYDAEGSYGVYPASKSKVTITITRTVKPY